MVTNSYTVATSAELATDLRAIDQTGSEAAPDTAYTFTFASSIRLSQQLDAINLDTGSSLTIIGHADTLDGAGTYSGLFVYSGTVTIDNLTVAQTRAVGGAGGIRGPGAVGPAGGGGGGAGLGGGLFVAAGATVALAGVIFNADSATGGAGGVTTRTGNFDGGGGGLEGGAGGSGGDGGGIGLSASGGGGLGIVPGAGPSATGAYPPNQAGGPSGGGGGSQGAGGGIGAGSQTGGFGGGGGTGAGGFGGGGAAVRPGGFGGGGGGASDAFASVGAGGGGFGGGNGGPATSQSTGGGGGGGLGAGGDIFVQQGGALTIEGGTLGTGTVTGGAGSNGGTAGDAFGSGLFIQGNETVTLAPGAGEALTVAGAIADEHGSVSSATPEGTLAIDGAGIVNLDARNSFSGGIVLSAGTLALNTAGAGGGGPIAFGGPALLDFGVQDVPGNVIDGFAVGNTIEITSFAGFAKTLDTSIGPYLTLPGEALISTGFGAFFVPESVTLDLPGLILSDLSVNTEGFETFLTTSKTRCFAAGTRIATPCCERAVETLRPGDEIFALGADGTRTIKRVHWIGKRTLELASHPDPDLAAPVRIRAGALAPGLPTRDLVLSPDHCLLLDGHLLRAFRLINGVSVVQERAASVTYVHVELDRHALLLAEGVAAESYLDEGHRGFFEGGMALPGPLHDRTGRACAPFVPDDAFAARLWQAVAGRAGVATPPVCRPRLSTSVLRLRAGGRMLKPVLAENRCCKFALPPGATFISLLPPVARPTDTRPWLEDRRCLGVMVSRIRLHADGEARDIALDGPQLGGGWHDEEQAGQRPARWTGGNAEILLPPCASAAILELTIAGAVMNAEPRQEAA